MTLEQKAGLLHVQPLCIADIGHSGEAGEVNIGNGRVR
jgi:hypothetical protein